MTFCEFSEKVDISVIRILSTFKKCEFPIFWKKKGVPQYPKCLIYENENPKIEILLHVKKYDIAWNSLKLNLRRKLKVGSAGFCATNYYSQLIL